jgi:23S rRNA (uracil1939-C5)-methyltransferase
VYGGDGLARRDGEVVLVPFVLPGEQVAVRQESKRGGVSRGTLVEVRTTSADRVEAQCPYFGRCGGCHYQHASYEAQVRAKVTILEETLRRGGVTAALPEIRTVTAEPWGYRNRAQFHFRGTELGYFESHSRDLCAIDHCPISSPRINETITILNKLARDSRWPRFVRSIEVFANETEVQLNVLETDRPVARRFFEWCAESIPGAAAGSLDYRAGNYAYRVGNRSFFQVNRFLVDALVKEVLEGMDGETALDLYAGVGLFSLPLTKRFQHLTAVESGAGATRDLRFNAERVNAPIEVIQSTADKYLDQLTTTPDFVLADPPRTGLGKPVVKRLLALGPAKFTIVACDPATLARDLSALAASDYTIASITLIDLFPQTFHIETVVRLQRIH